MASPSVDVAVDVVVVAIGPVTFGDAGGGLSESIGSTDMSGEVGGTGISGEDGGISSSGVSGIGGAVMMATPARFPMRIRGKCLLCPQNHHPCFFWCASHPVLHRHEV